MTDKDDEMFKISANLESINRTLLQIAQSLAALVIEVRKIEQK